MISYPLFLLNKNKLWEVSLLLPSLVTPMKIKVYIYMLVYTTEHCICMYMPTVYILVFIMCAVIEISIEMMIDDSAI